MVNRLYAWSGVRMNVLLVSAVFLSSVVPMLAQDPFEDGGVVTDAIGTHTESAAPSRKLTRDQAAKGFASFLKDVSRFDESASSFQRVMDSVSAKSKRELDYKLRPLFRAMSVQWKQSNQIVHIEGEGGAPTTATTEDASGPPTRPLVLVEEDGGWGVDLVETYARWNGFQGAAKAEAIYNLTGVMLKGVPRTEGMTRSSCQSNLKFIALSMAQYMNDSDEKYPPAKNWMNALQPYVQQEGIFTCPSLRQNQRYGYAYNSKLSTKAFDLLPTPASTVTVYETTTLKRNAYGMGESPAFRHQGGANYAFADGHVQWFAKGQTPNFKLKP